MIESIKFNEKSIETDELRHYLQFHINKNHLKILLASGNLSPCNRFVFEDYQWKVYFLYEKVQLYWYFSKKIITCRMLRFSIFFSVQLKRNFTYQIPAAIGPQELYPINRKMIANPRFFMSSLMIESKFDEEKL